MSLDGDPREPDENVYRIFAGPAALDRSDPRVMAQTYLAYTGTKDLRQWAVQLAAAGGVVVWLLAVWPDVVSRSFRQDVLILWLFLVAGAVVLRIVERRREVEFRRTWEAHEHHGGRDRMPGTE